MAAVRQLGADVLVVPRDACGRAELTSVLEQLRVESLLIEGGAGVITTALREHLVHRLVVCIAPRVIGQGIEAIGDLSVQRLEDALSFKRASFSLLADDVIFDGQL